MRNNLCSIPTFFLAVSLFLLGGVPIHAAPETVNEIELGIILSTLKEDHCFMFGSLGLSEEKSKDYLSGLGHELAFSEELETPWPDWNSVRIASIYCHAGVQGASDLANLMEKPEEVQVCETLEELFENCNSVFLVNTGGKGEANRELITAAIDADKPMFVDKFISTDPDEVRSLLEQAHKKEVRLLSASLLHFSAAGADLKTWLGYSKPDKVISTGWGGGNIAGDIHVIAHLQFLSGDRRPVEVLHEGEKEPKATVTFDDGLVGELVPRRPDTIFELTALKNGESKTVHYEGKHSRPSAVHMLNFVFDYFRGKNDGLPDHFMEDAIAIFAAAQESKESGEAVAIEN